MRPQAHVPSIAHKGSKDKRLDALLQLMVDRPQREIVFQAPESRFGFAQLHVELPQRGGILERQVGT